MIALLLGNDPAPTAFVVGGRYVLGVDVDGQPPFKALYSLGRRTEAKRNFIDKVIFEPVAAEPYYLHVQADGQEAIFILSVTAPGGSAAKLTVVWDEPAPRDRRLLSASIRSSGPLKTIGWSLFYNNAPIQSGTGTQARLPMMSPGIYRLIATGIDSYGNTVTADSSVVLPSDFGVQSVVTPQQPSDSTLYHIGDVYSPLIEGDAIQCSYLPYELTNISTVVKLVPGATHFKVELDPVHPDIDDEVIVRTAHGNWTLKGPPTGLSTEAMPYDYRHGSPVQPAPLDLSVRYTVEALNVHGSVANAFKFRVVFRCYRAGLTLFRYSPCDWSAYYGGSGERQRRIIALITNVDATLDAEWPDRRLGGGDQEPFAVPNQKRVIGSFTITGSPDRPLYQEDHFYTDQNAIARYESPDGDLRDLIVSCAYGLAGVRPCYLDFSQPAHPRIVQRIRRLSGKLVLYVAGGAFNTNTYVHVRIYTGKNPGYVTVSVPVLSPVYNPDYGSYAKVGEAVIDIPDFEFDRVGVLMDFRVDESVTQAGTAPYEPMHQLADDAYFTNVNSPAIKVDTACFRDPTIVPVFEGTFAGSAVPLPDCNRLPCGPVGIYCYTNTTTGTIPPTPNTPPVANNQSLTTPQDTPLDITLTASDTETPGSLLYAVTIGPVHGAISGNPSPPDIRYTPDPGFYGVDDFAFTVTDPGALSDSGVITINVTQAIPPNTPPTAIDKSITTPQDTPKAVTLAGFDAETPLSLAFAVTINPLHGNLTGVAPNLTYTPDLGYSGPDQFTFSVTDPGLLSDTGVVSIDVTAAPPVNTPPTANPQSVSLDQDTSLGITLTGSDAETPGSLAFAVVSGPFHGSLTGTAPNLTYTPNPSYVGSDSFTFSVTDPGLLSDTDVVSIAVNHVNHAPSATPQSISLDQDTSIGVTLAGTDPDGDSITGYAVTVSPTHGNLTGVAPNLTYTPDPGYAGPDSFQFTVTDNGTPNLTSAAATISITVNSTSPVFYALIGCYNPDSTCNSFITDGILNEATHLDDTDCVFQLVTRYATPVVVPPGGSPGPGGVGGVPLFLVKMDQRFLDIETFPSPAEDVVNTILVELFLDRWIAEDPENAATCAFSSTFHFANSAASLIGTFKGQQDADPMDPGSGYHAGTLADPFHWFTNIS